MDMDMEMEMEIIQENQNQRRRLQQQPLAIVKNAGTICVNDGRQLDISPETQCAFMVPTEIDVCQSNGDPHFTTCDGAKYV